MIELNSNIRSLSHSTASATFSLNEDCDSSASTKRKVAPPGEIVRSFNKEPTNYSRPPFEDFFHTGPRFMHSLF